MINYNPFIRFARLARDVARIKFSGIHSSGKGTGRDGSRGKIAQGMFPRAKGTDPKEVTGVGGQKAPIHNEESVHNWHMGVKGGTLNKKYYTGGEAIPDQEVDNIVNLHGDQHKNNLEGLTFSGGHRLIVKDRTRAAEIWNSGARGPAVSDKYGLRAGKTSVARRTDGDYLFYDTDLAQSPEELAKVIAANRQNPKRPWDRASTANVTTFNNKLTANRNFNRVEELNLPEDLLNGFKQQYNPEEENLAPNEIQEQYPYTDEKGARYKYKKDEMNWTHATAKKTVDLFATLPPDDTLVALAKAGELKRGWYQNYSDLVRNVFSFKKGEKLSTLRRAAISGDHNATQLFRFTGLLAATSPKVPVDENLNSTLHIYSSFQKLSDLQKDPHKNAAVLSELRNKALSAIENISPDLEPGSVRYEEQLRGYELMHFMDPNAAAAYVNRKSAYRNIKADQVANTKRDTAEYLARQGFSHERQLSPEDESHKAHYDAIQNIKDGHSTLYKDQESEINKNTIKSDPVFRAMYAKNLKKYTDDGYDTGEAIDLALRDTFNRFASQVNVGEGDAQTKHSVTGLSFGAWFSNASAALYRNIEDVSVYDKHHLFYGDEDSGEGRKVESFRRNLLGYLDASTNDSWQSNIGLVPQKLMGDERYHAFTAKVRNVAAKMGWKAAEVQETMWSFYRTLVNLVGSEDITIENALKTITVGELQDTDDFVGLLKDAVGEGKNKNARVLKHLIEQAGISPNTISQFEPSIKPPEGKYEDPKQRLWNTWDDEQRASVTDAVKSAGIHATSGSVGPKREQVAKGLEAYITGVHGKNPKHLGTIEARELKEQFNSLNESERERYLRIAKNPNIRKLSKLIRSGKPIKFAQFKPAPGGMTGAPVATRTNQPFSNAVAKSPGGKNLAQGALGNQINAKGGVNTTAQNAVGDWPNGSEESIVHTAPQGTDPRRLKYLGAWHGISGQKKSVLVFHPNPKGPDSLYHMEHPSTDMGEVREQLIAAGINYKTLLPGKTSTRVMVYDPNRGMRNTIDQFATNNNLNVEENIGQGEIVGHNGDWNSAGALPKSRQAYTNIIGEYEQNRNQAGPSNNTSGAPTNGTGTSTGQAQQLSRKTTNTTATKAKIKFDRSRRVLEGFLRQHNTPNKELPPVGDLLSQDLQNIKPEHLSKYQQLIPDAKWSDIEGAVTSLQKDPSLYDDMTSESNRREMYCKEHARTVLQSSGLKKLIDSLRVQNLIPEHAQHLIEDAKDGDYFSLEAISSELQHSVPSLRAFSKAAEKEYNKAGKAWDKMRTGQPQKFAKKSAHAKNQYRAGPHGVAFRGLNYNGGQFAPQNDGVKRFEKDSNLTHMIKKLRGV